MNKDIVNTLIQQSQLGDTKAFEKLVKEFQPLVFRLAFRLLCNEEDAKDMVQETFIKVWKNLNRYEFKYLFSTWIYKIMQNLCYDKLRSAKQTKIYLSNISLAEQNFISSENIEKDVINKELGEYILFFTQNLTPKQKIVFTLRDIEGLEVNEIEKITGLSPNKIKSNLYLARNKIKEQINTITL